MDSTFGARLRAQRELQQVSLETIAERTKIRIALLEGLERDDLSLWPRGIFRRSYLRSYAVAIGLEPEKTVQEFVVRFPEPAVEPEAIAALAPTAESSGRRPPMRLQYLIASALGALSHKGAKPAESASVAAPAIEQPAPAVATDAAALDSPAAEPTSAPDRASAEAVAPPFELTSPVFTAPPSAAEIDLPAMAHLCTRIVEASCVADLTFLLEEASRLLHASGLIVWLWDAQRSALCAALSHGYSRQTLARLPALGADADNPIGSAFRSMACQVVSGGSTETGAMALPIMTPGGPAGVLAVECTGGLEQDKSLQALATILAAQLSLLVEAAPAVRTAIA